MHTHDQASDDKSISIMDFYGSDGTPILAMVHDMIKAYAATHSIITRLLYNAVEDFQNGNRTIQEILTVLEFGVLPQCKNGVFPDTASNIESMLINMRMDLITPNEVNNKLAYIRNRAMEEGEQLMLFPVNSERVKHYNQPQLFGSKIATKFPGAQRDITEAGTCYALGCWTASILHLMRALEYALKILAKSVRKLPNGNKFTYGVKDPMGKIALNLTAHAIKLPTNTKTDLQYARKINAASVYFEAITKAVRNNVAHSTDFYSQKQAQTVLVNTEQFLENLSDIVKTPRRRKNETIVP